MPSLLKISVRFLLDEFDGRGDGGEPEWPPSPLRLFQTLTNSAARLGMDAFAPSLEQLEELPPPLIAASKPAAVQPRFGFKTFVPNNVGDLVAKSWISGRDNDIANYRAAKGIRPTRLPENAAVHYLWEIDGATPRQFISDIRQLARAISSFGWGVNMVVADATAVDSGNLSDAFADSEEWFPSENGGAALRVPVTGTLAALKDRHNAFLGRLPTALDGSQLFRPVPPLESFRVATYRRESELACPLYAVFTLRQLDDSGYRAFDPIRRGLQVAGMLRHTASQPELARSLGWSKDEIARLVLGHGEARGETHSPVAGPRFALVPLPSIEWRGGDKKLCVGSVRRVLVTALGSIDRESFARFVRQLNGQELIDAKTSIATAVLIRQPSTDSVAQRYLQESSTWATVTPVILPGFDDPRNLRKRLSADNTHPLTAVEKNELIRKLDARIEHLLRKAIIQGGLPESLAQYAELDWRSVGFWPGTELVSLYAVPEQHRRYRRLHVRITWRSPDGQPLKVAGPICLGGGKHTGLGLFAALPSEAS